MSVPDEFFDNSKEEDTKTPFAKLVVVVLAVILVVYISKIAYEKYSINSLRNEDNSLTVEQREKILSEINKAASSSALTPKERSKILFEIEKTKSAAPVLSESERNIILNEISAQQAK